MSKKCESCGMMIPDDAEFCPECGAKQAPAARKCPYCGAENEEDAVFCGNCGKSLKQDAPGAGTPDAQGTVPPVPPVPPFNGQPQQGTGPANSQHFPYKLPAQGPVGNQKRFFAIIGAIIIVIAAFFCFSSFQKPIHIKAQDLANAYIRDQAAADKKYKGKNLDITGEVVHKGQFSNAQDYGINIYTRHVGGKYYKIIISVPHKDADKVNKVKFGDFVSAQGKCMGIVPQKDPTIISIQIEAEKLNE
jgi:hypothetical protein